MDAASNLKLFLTLLVTCFASNCFAQSVDTVAPAVGPTGGAPCCAAGEKCSASECKECPTAKCERDNQGYKQGCSLVLTDSPVSEIVVDTQEKTDRHPGFATMLSDWLFSSPKLSAQFAIRIGADNTTSKLGANAPSVATPSLQNTESDAAHKTLLTQVPHIAKPMKFAQGIRHIQLGELVGDVIVCGHRICSGNKCYDVKDEPVHGVHCDKTNETAEESAEEEPILVVPMAPPAPPGLSVAQTESPTTETEAAAVLRSAGMHHVNVSLPMTTVVDLLVTKTELSTRLEMSEQLATERLQFMEHVQELTERNAKLSTQLAVAEARQQVSEVLTASLVERAELAIKLATVESKSGTAKETTTGRTVQAIQEDLSNIRRQIALLKRSQPVPFAPSYVGLTAPRPYIPTAQLLESQLSEETSNQDETESDETSETSETIVK